MEPKIKIDWSELNRPEVDQRLEQDRIIKQSATYFQPNQGINATPAGNAAPGQQEYGRINMAPPMGAQMAGGGGGGLFYSAVVYNCIAGLFTALIGFGIAELTKVNQLEITAIADLYRNAALLFCIIGACIGVGLSSMEHLVGRAYQTALRSGLIGLGVGLLGGAVAGLIAQFVYSTLLEQQQSFAMHVLARSIGWGIAGALIGLGQGMAANSGKKLRNGLLGGLIGGLIGGVLFDFIGTKTETATLSRGVAIGIIGAAMGLMTGAVENLLKDAWLRVTGGPLTGKQFVIYRNPTVFGNSQKSDIYLFKDPSIEPRHALLYSSPQGFILEDCQSRAGTYVNGQRIGQHRLRPNDTIQIGQYAFVYDEKIRQQMPGMQPGMRL